MTDKLIQKYGTHKNGHSIFAPSGSAGWLNCSGYLLVNARASDSAGLDAVIGTVAHSVADEWNKSGVRPDHMLGQVQTHVAGGNEYTVEVTADMFYHVGRYVEWCREVPGDHYFEQRVDLSELLPIPEQWGTADHFVCEPFKLTITDLKYGTGVRVYARGNTQALLYASGVFLEWDWIYRFEQIVIRICQVRLDVFETWEITRQELLDFMAYVQVRARAAWVENAPRTPSEKACMWCAGFERCPARMAMFDEIVNGTAAFDEDLEDEDRPPATFTKEQLEDHNRIVRSMGAAAGSLTHPEIEHEMREMSTAALAYAYGYRKTVEKWFKLIGDLLLDRAEKGYDVPHWQLSEGRKIRRFKDAAAAQKFILESTPLDADAIAPRKLLSVKKAETAIRKATGMKPKELAEFWGDKIDVVQSKRSLIPVIDGEAREDDELTDDFDAEDDDL